MKKIFNIKLNKKIVITASVITTIALSLFTLDILEKRNINEIFDAQKEKIEKQGHKIEYGTIKSSLFTNKVTTLNTKITVEGINIYIDEGIEHKKHILNFKKDPYYIPKYMEIHANGIHFDTEVMQALGLTKENTISLKNIREQKGDTHKGTSYINIKHRLSSLASVAVTDFKEFKKASRILEIRNFEELSDKEAFELLDTLKIKEFKILMEDKGIYNYLKVKYFFIFAHNKEIIKAVRESEDYTQTQKDVLVNFIESPKKIEIIFKNEKALSFTKIANILMAGNIPDIELIFKLNDKKIPFDLAGSVSKAAKLVEAAQARRDNANK